MLTPAQALARSKHARDGMPRVLRHGSEPICHSAAATRQQPLPPIRVVVGLRVVRPARDAPFGIPDTKFLLAPLGVVPREYVDAPLSSFASSP